MTFARVDLEQFRRRAWAEKTEYNERTGTIRIVARSKNCTCALVEKGLTPSDQCECTLGWQKQTYSAILGKPVEAELEEFDPARRQPLRVSHSGFVARAPLDGSRRGRRRRAPILVSQHQTGQCFGCSVSHRYLFQDLVNMQLRTKPRQQDLFRKDSAAWLRLCLLLYCPRNVQRRRLLHWHLKPKLLRCPRPEFASSPSALGTHPAPSPRWLQAHSSPSRWCLRFAN